MVNGEYSDDGYVTAEEKRNIYEQQQRQQFNIWQFSSDELVYIEETLKGKSFNNETGKWEKVDAVAPVMNQRGITEFVNWLRVQLDKKNQLSNLNEKEVPLFASTLYNSMVHIMIVNYWSWDMTEEKMEYVYSLCEFPLYCIIKRAYKAGALQAIGKTTQAIEHNIMESKLRRPEDRGLNK